MTASAVTPERDPLSPFERRMVNAIVAAASRGVELTRTEAGRAAGYAGTESARVQASRALQRPHVRAALIEGMRAIAQVDAPASYAVIRHLARKSGSDRVRLDAAAMGLRIAGLDLAPEGDTGVSLTLNLHIGGEAGTLLTQRLQQAPQTHTYQGPPVIEHSPMEGAGGQDDPGHPPTPSRAGGAR